MNWSSKPVGRKASIGATWLSMVAMALLLASGIWYFRRMERTYAGVI